MKELLKECEAIFEELRTIRREIHEYPDIGMNCDHTVRIITAFLEKEKIPCQISAHGGVVCDLHGTRADSDHIVLIRADMDALPLVEETGLPFSSKISGRMHACGHDMHVAILLGSAKLLHLHRNEFSGTVRLLFQPGEEISEGAMAMIEDHVMDGVDMILGLHMDPFAPVGTIRVREGADWAAVDRFTITIHGTSSHGAMPQKGADATVAASAVLQALQTVVSRQTNPVSPLVITVGSFHSGTAWNIISDLAIMEGTCRCFDQEIYDALPDLLERVVTEIPKAYGCTGEISMNRKSSPVINDPAVYELFCSAASKVIGSDRVLPAEKEMIGEDFACYLSFAPGCFVHLGGESTCPLHSSHIVFQEEAIPFGTAAEVQFAMDALAKMNHQ